MTKEKRIGLLCAVSYVAGCILFATGYTGESFAILATNAGLVAFDLLGPNKLF